MGYPQEPPETPEMPKCPVCGEAFSRSTVVLCRDCSSPHHRKCWKFNKGCATYGCQCRTFVLPPVAAGDCIDFSARGQPHMMTMMFLIPAFVFTVVLGGALLPKAIADIVIGSMTALFVPGILAASLGPVLTERRYLLEPETGSIDRSIYFGPFKVREQKGWKTFSDVEEMEVRSARMMGQKANEAMHMLEVWMRDREGQRHLLDSSPFSEREANIEKARAAADVVDTTLGLPREVESARALPANLSRAMASLPRHEGQAPALPEGPEDPEVD